MRLTISLDPNLYTRLSAIAVQNDASLSKVINKLIEVGMHDSFKTKDHSDNTESASAYCHKLIIEMNTLIKNMSKEILHLGQDDFARLKILAENKYSEMT